MIRITDVVAGVARAARDLPAILLNLRAYVATAVALVLTACGDGGVIGELKSKPVAADLSRLYYNAMCQAGNSGVAYRSDIRALKVEMDNGSCAVLYLDAIDRQGDLLLFPYSTRTFLSCSGLDELLVRYAAHPKVIEKAISSCVPPA